MLKRFLFWRRRNTNNKSEDKTVKRLNEVIPAFVPRILLWTKIKDFTKMMFLRVAIIVTIAVICVVAFLVYRIVKDRDYFVHHLKENSTVAFTLSDTVSLQSPSLQKALNKLTEQDSPLEKKLLEIAAEGYNGWYESDLIIYNEKERDKYRQIYEERVLTAIEQAYKIYNDFDTVTEREVYGITSDELVYQKGLTIEEHSPITIKQTLFEGRKYFPFALIAGEVSGIEPLEIIKIFEIETEFNEVVVGKNDNRKKNFDIGLGQNNLLVIPGLIRDMLDTGSPVYSPVFEFMTVCKDLETKKLLNWSEYLPRLEEELNGNYNKDINPTGEYYINALKAPHICAFLAAYHIKRDRLLSCYPECQQFYKNNAVKIKELFKLDVDIEPSEWTNYTFYNGGPLRWRLVKEYINRCNSNRKISKRLQKAVSNTVRRNLKAQKIALKNKSFQSLIFDNNKDELVKNDGSSRYGLYDFTANYKKSLLYNLEYQLDVVKNVEAHKDVDSLVKGQM